MKMRFDYGDVASGEHMWLTDLYLKDNKLYGVLDSSPVDVTNVKSGDTLEIETDRVSDWMYIEDGKLVGGYTMKVLYDRMSKDEQQKVEQEVGARLR